MKLRLIGFVTAAILASALTTMAQVAKMEGTITGKGADGKVIPIEGATVDIWRTDIKTDKPYTVKTNKSGDYIHAGIPYSGKYVLLVSAAGWAPGYVQDVSPEHPPRNDLQLVPGDGRRITLEDFQTAMKNMSAASSKNDAEAKKKADENRKASEAFEKMKKTFEEGLEFYKKGNEFYDKKDYPSAIAQFK